MDIWNKKKDTDDIKSTSKGISCKIKLYEFENEVKYSTINVFYSGKIELKMAFKDKFNANFNNVKKGIDDCKKFIKIINEIDFRSDKNDELKLIKLPEMYIDNETVTFSDNINLAYISNDINIWRRTEYKF